jgi:hypothetical protein
MQNILPRGVCNFHSPLPRVYQLPTLKLDWEDLFSISCGLSRYVAQCVAQWGFRLRYPMSSWLPKRIEIRFAPRSSGWAFLQTAILPFFPTNFLSHTTHYAPAVRPSPRYFRVQDTRISSHPSPSPFSIPTALSSQLTMIRRRYMRTCAVHIHSLPSLLSKIIVNQPPNRLHEPFDFVTADVEGGRDDDMVSSNAICRTRTRIDVDQVFL